MRTLPLTLRASAAQNTATTVTGSAVVIPDTYDMLTVFADATVMGTLSSDTLKVYIDTSFDGGSTWVNIGLIAFAGNTTAPQNQAITFSKAAITAAASQPVDVTSDLAAAGVRQIGFGDQLRYRGTTAGTPTYTYSVTGYARN